MKQTQLPRNKGPNAVELDYMCGAYSPVRMRKTPAVHDNIKKFKSSHIDTARTSRHARISAAATNHTREQQYFLSTHPIRFMFVFIAFDTLLRFYTCLLKYQMDTGKRVKALQNNNVIMNYNQCLHEYGCRLKPVQCRLKQCNAIKHSTFFQRLRIAGGATRCNARWPLCSRLRARLAQGAPAPPADTHGWLCSRTNDLAGAPAPSSRSVGAPTWRHLDVGCRGAKPPGSA